MKGNSEQFLHNPFYTIHEPCLVYVKYTKENCKREFSARYFLT